MEGLVDSAKHSMYCGLLGSVVGLTLGNVRGNMLVHSYYTSTNWLIVSFPFFLTRKLLLNVSSPMQASIGAGSLVGGCISFYQRGRILPGFILYGLLAGAANSVYSWIRVQRLLAADKPSSESFTLNSKELFTANLRSNLPVHVTQDPVSSLLNWVRDKINHKYNPPVWASPVLNAVDLNYRRKLNYQIEYLEQQIAELGLELSRRISNQS
jgi:hypothetical protein